MQNSKSHIIAYAKNKHRPFSICHFGKANDFSNEFLLITLKVAWSSFETAFVPNRLIKTNRAIQKTLCAYGLKVENDKNGSH